MQEDIIDEISKREANSTNALTAGSISADMLRDEVRSLSLRSVECNEHLTDAGAQPK